MRRSFILPRLAVFASVCLAAAAPWALASAQSDESRAGADLSGCRGAAISVGPDGRPKGSVVVPGGPPSSASKPLHVDSDGTVEWQGSTDAVIRDITWTAKLFGVTVHSASGANAAGKTSDEGVEDVGDYLPFKVTGLYHIDFHLEGDGGECTGDLWVKLDGNHFGTVPWIAGVGLIALGAVGLWLARPTRPAAAKPTPAGGDA